MGMLVLSFKGGIFNEQRTTFGLRLLGGPNKRDKIRSGCITVFSRSPCCGKIDVAMSPHAVSIVVPTVGKDQHMGGIPHRPVLPDARKEKGGGGSFGALSGCSQPTHRHQKHFPRGNEMKFTEQADFRDTNFFWRLQVGGSNGLTLCCDGMDLEGLNKSLSSSSRNSAHWMYSARGLASPL